ncbi:MAG: hypothetical protein AAFU58_06805, partial [Pseudomonadota bacterium]
PYTTEITLIDLNFSSQLIGFLSKLFGNDNAQAVIELSGGNLIYTDQQTGRSSRRSRNEVFKKPIRLIMR